MYIGNQPLTKATLDRRTYTGTATDTFNFSYNRNFLQVYVNGLMLQNGEDYTAQNGTSVVLVNVVDVDDVVEFINFNTFNVANVDTTAGATGGGQDKVFWLNDKQVTADFTVPANQNAGVWGPIEVVAGVNIIVEDGATLTIA